MKSVQVPRYCALTGLALAFVVTGSAQTFAVNPQALSFTYQINGPNPPAQSLFVSSATPAAQFAVTISGAPWLSVAPSTGVAPSTLTVTLNGSATGQTPGNFTGQIIIGPPASADSVKTVIPVTLQVLGPPQGSLVVTPESLTFDYQVGGPYPSMKPVAVQSTGSPAAFTISGSVPWVGYSASGYTTPATVFVSVVPLLAMGPGVYQTFLTVNPAYAGGAAKQIFVTLRISTGGVLTANPQSLSFQHQPGGAAPPSQVVSVVNSIGGAASFTVAASTVNGGNWLAYNPSNATTPASIVVSAVPGNLSPGIYSGTLFLTPSSGSGRTEIPVTLTVNSASQLTVDPDNLYFTYQAGGPAPAHQYLTVKSTGVAVTFGVAVQGPSWITTSTAGGTTPTGFTVSAIPPPNTPTGTYTATVTMTPSNGGGSAIGVPVSVNVSSANYLTVGQTALSFDYGVNGATPAPAVVPVTSSGPSIRFEAVAAASGFGPWLHVTQSSQYTPANLSVSVSPQGLAPGTYYGTVVINSEGASNGQQQIDVTLVVTKTTTLTASPFALVFSGQIAGTAPAAQAFVVSSVGGPASFTSKASTKLGGNWLTVVGQGSTPATAAAAVNISGLGVGTYTGQISVTPDDASLPILDIPVVLNVSAAPVFQPAATQVAFQWQTTTAAPAPQKVTIRSSGDPIVFYPTVLTADGGSWLTATPDIGTTPTDLTISVNTKGLTAGLYYGLVGLTDPAGDSPTSFVPVTLQVGDGPILIIPSQVLTFNAKAGVGGSASQTIPVKAAQALSFHTTTSGGNWLTATPIDGRTDGIVSVDANAEALSAGSYLGIVTIQIPGTPNSAQYTPVVLVVAPGS